ncbi:PAS domain-containing protein, partial [Agrobacterium sp.]|uniref:PAS domain-containing protein n=1 Tax=Agrobacterium sp. TaxID=361 RepID=UPI0028AFBDFA
MTQKDQKQVDARRAGDLLVSGHVSEDPFAAAFKATRMPMIVTDPNQHDNPIIFCNAAFNKLTGYENDEIIGNNCRMLQGPESDPDVIAKMRNAIAAGEDVAVDILNYRKDGSPFWNAVFISPVRDAGGKIMYFFASQL